MILFLCILWYVIGVASFIYWWTNEYDFELDPSTIFVTLLTGLMGPITFPIGWSIHGTHEYNPPKVLIKKRSKK